MESSFGSTVSSVPHLATMCIAALASEVSCSGLKIMRLVNCELSMSMLSMVQRYSLILNGNAHGLLDEMTLLENTSLSSLHVVVKDHCEGASVFSLDCLKRHAQHLSCFAYGLNTALSTITNMEIELEMAVFKSGSAEEIEKLLTVLVLASPRLQRLTVSRKVGLPPGPCCMALFSCTSLSFLDVGLCKLSQAEWTAIPASLTELRCSLAGVPPEGLTTLNGLQRLFCHREEAAYLDFFTALIATLRVMPALKSLALGYRHDAQAGGKCGISRIDVSCLHSNITNLTYLNDRVSAGLVVFHINAITKGVHISLEDVDFKIAVFEQRAALDEDAMDCIHLLRFMQLLPVFSEEFLGLSIDIENREVCMSAVIDEIARSFPGLQCIMFHSVGLDSIKEVANFEACKALKCLSFWNIAGLTALPLASLCSRAQSLKELQVINCSSFTEGESAMLRYLLHCAQHTIKLVAGNSTLVLLGSEMIRVNDLFDV